MEVLENTELNGKDVIFAKSKVTKLGGFLGFIARFLRVYKESNNFDSYIDPNIHMSVQYDVYNLKDDGSRKTTERVHFDRERNKVLSLESNKTLIANPPPDIQDVFSLFLSLLTKLNSEEIYVGRKFEENLYAYGKVARIEAEVTHFALVDGKPVYIMEIEKLPAVFKYPASVRLKVTDVGDGFMFVTEGKCTIHIPVMPDITVNVEVEVLKRAG
jgi:hypothetical protein